MLISIVPGKLKIHKVWLDMGSNLVSDLFTQGRSIFKAIKRIRFKEPLMEYITSKHSSIPLNLHQSRYRTASKISYIYKASKPIKR